jgi:hypothetical protein
MQLITRPKMTITNKLLEITLFLVFIIVSIINICLWHADVFVPVMLLLQNTDINPPGTLDEIVWQVYS